MNFSGDRKSGFSSGRVCIKRKTTSCFFDLGQDNRNSDLLFCIKFTKQEKYQISASTIVRSECPYIYRNPSDHSPRYGRYCHTEPSFRRNGSSGRSAGNGKAKVLPAYKRCMQRRPALTRLKVSGVIPKRETI